MLTEIVEAVAPGARLIGSRAFAGGLSSEMILVDAERDDGERLRFVVRHARGDRGSIPMAAEYQLLGAVWARGLPVPEPLHFDESGLLSEQPYMALGYIEGEPRFTDEDPLGVAEGLADLLAAVHGVDGADDAFAFLPERSETVTAVLERRVSVDDSIGEGRILDALRAHWPPGPPMRSSLLHCDVWLGNVLWSGPDVVGVIDWENAHVGDPLADLAIVRLECAWSFGREAVDALTDRYASRTGVDLGQLAIWDLAAARRPAGEMSRWAGDWGSFGRPDMTAARMRAAHRWFVDEALRQL